jgi:dUTP pyrophosphatase
MFYVICILEGMSVAQLNGINYIKIANMKDKFVVLRMYLGDLPDSSHDSSVVEKYVGAVEKQQDMVVKYVDRYFGLGSGLGSGSVLGEDVYIDAGFDLFVPNLVTVDVGETKRIDMGVKCSMTYNGVPCSYYMYPRSSTGSNTPLRLANSVGIIDSGYRGNLMAVFDNIKDGVVCEVETGDRLVQICSGSLLYPVFPIIVNSVEELGSTERGEGGFGSSGR